MSASHQLRFGRQPANQRSNLAALFLSWWPGTLRKSIYIWQSPGKEKKKTLKTAKCYLFEVRSADERNQAAGNRSSQGSGKQKRRAAHHSGDGQRLRRIYRLLCYLHGN